MKWVSSQPWSLVTARQQRLLGQLLRNFIAVLPKLIRYSVLQTPH